MEGECGEGSRVEGAEGVVSVRMDQAAVVLGLVVWEGFCG